MKLGDKIPVPELDELRVARMERAIVAEVAAHPAKESRPHRARDAAIGMVAVAGVVLAIFLNLRAAQVPLLDRSRTCPGYRPCACACVAHNCAGARYSPVMHRDPASQGSPSSPRAGQPGRPVSTDRRHR